MTHRAPASPPVIGFCAYSGTGKTTLLKALIPRLVASGLNIGIIKHAHHEFDTDQPGKDSYELRKAGARQTLVSSARRNALITELDNGEPEPGLNQLIQQLDGDRLDLILVEGFKREAFKKIELHRCATGKPFMYPDDPDIIAIASDEAPPEPSPIPVYDINDIDALAGFIIRNIVRLRQDAK